MLEMVVRLTRDSLTLGILVVAADRSVMFANRHVREASGATPPALSSEAPRPLGVARSS